MEKILKYFPDINETQKKQFEMLGELYRSLNEKVNVISRKDTENIYEHHVLHSLAIAKAFSFPDGAEILDFGTGGGFPGVPLSIMFPNCRFTLIDGTGKKIRVAEEVSNAIGLKNCFPVHRRGEEEKGKYDFIVSRAVMQLPMLVKLMKKNLSTVQRGNVKNGIICLKGGDLTEELRPYAKKVVMTPVSDFFQEEWFNEKYVIYLPR